MYLSKSFKGTAKEVQEALNKLPKDYSILAINLDGNEFVQTCHVVCQEKEKEDYAEIISKVFEAAKGGIEELTGLDFEEFKEKAFETPAYVENHFDDSLDERFEALELKVMELQGALDKMAKPKTTRKPRVKKVKVDNPTTA